MRLQIYEKKNDTTKAAYPSLRGVLPDTDSLPQVLLFFSLPPVCPQTTENEQPRFLYVEFWDSRSFVEVASFYLLKKLLKFRVAGC